MKVLSQSFEPHVCVVSTPVFANPVETHFYIQSLLMESNMIVLYYKQGSDDYLVGDYFVCGACILPIFECIFFREKTILLLVFCFSLELVL